MANRFGYIYEIRNKINNLVYIGSTTQSNPKCRWYNHRSMLRLGNHDNEYLQRAWNKYGEEAFEWSILMKCQPNEMYEWEQAFHDIMREMFGVYNIGGFVQSPRLGIKHTDESKIKISKNREYKYGVENPSYGRKWTEEQRLQHVKMNSKLTGNREVIVCEMYVSGISSLQLANQFDVSRSAIDRCLKRHNIQKRTAGECLKGRKQPIELVEKIKAIKKVNRQINE